jgi:hypothetical protein
MIKSKINHKTYILSILAIVLLITTSLEIYLPIVNSEQGTLSMFFFNLFGLLFLHHYCNRGRFRHYDLKNTNQPLETLVIFFCQLLIIVQLLFVIIVFIFFSTQRISMGDLVILLIIQTYLFSMGDEYNIFEVRE